MGPIAALDSVFTKFFSVRGRASRSEYWWFVFMRVVILFAAIAGDLLLFDPNAPVSLNPLSYFSGMWILITIIPSFTVAIRRLHDTGRSGLYYFTQGVPLVGGLLFLILMCLDSERGDNLYGPPPFGPRGSTYSGVSDIDLGIAQIAPQKPVKHNPYAGYAYLDRADEAPSPEMIAARKEAVSELYRTRVLGQKPSPQHG